MIAMCKYVTIWNDIISNHESTEEEQRVATMLVWMCKCMERNYTSDVMN